MCRKAIGKIALGDDAFDRVPVAAHDQGTNLPGAQLPGEKKRGFVKYLNRTEPLRALPND